jgi:hypothetical protein
MPSTEDTLAMRTARHPPAIRRMTLQRILLARPKRQRITLASGVMTRSDHHPSRRQGGGGTRTHKSAAHCATRRRGATTRKTCASRHIRRRGNNKPTNQHASRPHGGGAHTHNESKLCHARAENMVAEREDRALHRPAEQRTHIRRAKAFTPRRASKR